MILMARVRIEVQTSGGDVHEKKQGGIKTSHPGMLKLKSVGG